MHGLSDADSTKNLKSALRQKFLAKRLALSPENVWEEQRAIGDYLSQWTRFHEAQRILSFLAFRNEPDLTALMGAYPEKQWAVPRCVGQELVWHVYPSPIRKNSYGIPEPLADSPLFDPTEADLCLVPLLAWDSRGYRLGYGGGFYDRFLVSYPLETIGIVHRAFGVDILPFDPAWDIPLKAVCTGEGVRIFGG
ncbi:MAG: 5-formyltetrahydrofolate cyclo-ligase [Gloeobacterales cyanobacterium]